MTHIEPLTITLNLSRLSLGYTVLNMDRTQFAAFSTVGMAEVGSSGVYSVAGGVAVPASDGYIQVHKAPAGAEFVGEAAVKSIAVAHNGSGAVPWTYTVCSDADNLTPIPQARVEVSNEDGTLLVTQAHTDNNGQVTFYLDPGAYNLRRTEAGWSFTNPDTEIVEESSP
jgi:hypothetical protein